MAVQILDNNTTPSFKKLPQWFKQDLPDTGQINRMKELFRSGKLYTVCESAHCPNMGKCWGQGVATFMILGETCTRACRFCAVKAGIPTAVDTEEPINVAMAVKELNLRYVVVTSVARDDLEDEGADQFVQTIRKTRELTRHIKIEVLVPDFSNKFESIRAVVLEKPEVFGHNIETVKRLSNDIRPQADYQRSLDVLQTVKKINPYMITKSSIMLGLGESREEIIETMKDLVRVGCDILTIGQYLAPSQMRRHLSVVRFVDPDEFEEYAQIGRQLGLKHVMSSTLR